MFSRFFTYSTMAFFTLLCICQSTTYADVFDYYCDDVDDDYIELDYIRIGGGFVNVGQYGSFLPILSAGRRYESCEYGVDYSLNAGYVKGMEGNPRSVFYYSIPRILCLCFASPCSTYSVYYGGGASWTGIINNNSKQSFHGVAADVTLGLELQRNCQIRSFLQLDATQPVLPAYRKGKFPTPTVQFSFGLGF